MNIELLRRTRESVANPKTVINLNSWGTCIAGHLFAIVGQQDDATDERPFMRVQKLLDIAESETFSLVRAVDPYLDHREIALARIDALLEKHGEEAPIPFAVVAIVAEQVWRGSGQRELVICERNWYA